MSNSTDPILVDTYRFTPADLNAGDRLPGVSAFMRIKNGADFLESTIRSHIGHVDEIVAVYNQCTDSTPEILARLAGEFAPKIRVFHYVPKVHAPGSEGHAREPADSPASFVNMSNFALAQTRYRVAVKLDDDHLAIEAPLEAIISIIRHDGYRPSSVFCLSGLNVARDERGRCGILSMEPFSGSGDTGLFAVSPRTMFVHRARHEAFDHAGQKRVFGDFAYWHLKYLKTGFGFENRDIAAGNPRFARKRDAFHADRRVITMAELQSRAPTWMSVAKLLPLPEKMRLKLDRWQRLVESPPDEAGLEAAAALVSGKAAAPPGTLGTTSGTDYQ